MMYLAATVLPAPLSPLGEKGGELDRERDFNGPPTAPPCRCPPASPDDHTLVLAVDQHVAVHLIRQCVDVWGVFVLGL